MELAATSIQDATPPPSTINATAFGPDTNKVGNFSNVDNLGVGVGRSSQPIEQDTVEVEDISNIYEFLMKDGAVPDFASQFSLSYSRACLEGWVKQPSPCCGAASIAGAWNALSNLKRTDPRALNHISILNIYRIMFVDMIEKKTTSFENKLGHSIKRIIADIRTQLFGVNPCHSIKGKNVTQKAFNLSMKTIMMKYLDSLAVVATPTAPEGGGEVTSVGADVEEVEVRDDLQALIDLYLADGGVLDKDSILLADGPALDLVADAIGGEETKDIGEEEDGDFEEIDGEEVDTNIVISIPNKVAGKKPIPSKFKSRFPSKSTEDASNASVVIVGDKRPGGGSSNQSEGDATALATDSATASAQPSMKISKNDWDWKGDLKGILMNMGGLMRLMDEKPSTTAIGNWGILQCIQKLSQWTGLGSSLDARLFMGKKLNKMQKVAHPVLKGDDQATIGAQWDALRAAFLRSDTVLLFHLTNHYALIYALREWNEEVVVVPEGGGVGSSSNHGNDNSDGLVRVIHRRQILTARRGQRPTAWLDFSEVRDILLGWEGFKIMDIRRTACSSPGLVSQPTTSRSLVSSENACNSSSSSNGATNGEPNEAKKKKEEKPKPNPDIHQVAYFDAKSAAILYPTDEKYNFIFQ